MIEVIQNGDQFDWSPTFQNNGGFDEPQAEVVLTLPVGIDLIAAPVLPKGSLDIPTLTWDIGLFKKGFSYTPTFTFEVSDITQLGDIDADISGINDDVDLTNNNTSVTIQLAADPVAAAVDFDYGCLCGNVSSNDTPCNTCETVYKVVAFSEINLVIDYFNEATGEYRVTLTDATLDGSFQYYIQCECDGLPPVVQNTATETILALMGAPIDTHWFNTDITQLADRSHNQGDKDTELIGVKTLRFEGTGNEAFIELTGVVGASSVVMGATNGVATSLLPIDPDIAFMQNDDGTNIATVVVENGQVILDSDKPEYVIFTAPDPDNTIDDIIVRDPITGILYLRDATTTDTNFMDNDLGPQGGTRLHDQNDQDTEIENIKNFQLTGNNSDTKFYLKDDGGVEEVFLQAEDSVAATTNTWLSVASTQIKSQAEDGVDTASFTLVPTRLTVDSTSQEYYMTTAPTTDNTKDLMLMRHTDGRIYIRTVDSITSNDWFNADLTLAAERDHDGDGYQFHVHSLGDATDNGTFGFYNGVTDLENGFQFGYNEQVNPVGGGVEGEPSQVVSGDANGIGMFYSITPADTRFWTGKFLPATYNKGLRINDDLFLENVLPSGVGETISMSGSLMLIDQESATGNSTITFGSKDIRLEAEENIHFDNIPANASPTAFVTIDESGDWQVSYTLLADVAASTDTNWFITNLTQDGNRVHDQAGYTTVVDNVDELTFQGDNANSFIELDDNTGVGVITLQAHNVTTTEYTNVVVDTENVTILSEDDTAAPTETASILVDHTDGVKLLSTEQNYYIGDATDYPPQDNTQEEIVTVDKTDGKVHLRDASTLSDSLLEEYEVYAVPATTELTVGITDGFFVVSRDMVGKTIRKIAIRAFDGTITGEETSTVEIHQEVTCVDGSTRTSAIKTFTQVDNCLQEDDTLNVSIAAGDIIFAEVTVYGAVVDDITGLTFVLTLGPAAP